MREDAVSALSCSLCDIAAKRRKLFLWGASVRLGFGQVSEVTTFNTLSFPYSPTDGGRESPFPAQSLQVRAVVFPFNYLQMKDYCILQFLSFLRHFATEALRSSGKALCAATAHQCNLG